MLDRFAAAAREFVSNPASAKPLAALRIGLASVLILQALSLSGDLDLLYGEVGVVQWNVMDAPGEASTAAPGVPRLRWLADLLAPWGVSATAAARLCFIAYVAALGCLLLGWRTRLAGVTAWLLHLALNTSGSLTIYGVDQFANIGLFYCAVMPVGHWWSLDVQSGRVRAVPTVEARISLRVLQVHLCVVYLATGLEKAAGIQWWNGEAVWRAVNLPELVSPIPFGWMAFTPWLATFAALATLAVELGYPFLIWPRRTRVWTALATLGLHAGIAVGMGLVSFAAVMMVLTSSAFLVSPETARPAPRGGKPGFVGKPSNPSPACGRGIASAATHN